MIETRCVTPGGRAGTCRGPPHRDLGSLWKSGPALTLQGDLTAVTWEKMPRLAEPQEEVGMCGWGGRRAGGGGPGAGEGAVLEAGRPLAFPLLGKKQITP